MLTVNNIEVVYWGTILVLKGVSLSVSEGKITALIGANGAGKTTTLKAITGLVRLERGEVTRGSIEFEGRRIENLSPEDTSRLGIVMVREGRRLFEELTAEENLLVGAALGLRRRRQRGWSVGMWGETSSAHPPAGGLRPNIQGAGARGHRAGGGDGERSRSAWQVGRPRATAAGLEMVYTYFPRLRDRRRVRAGYLSGGEQQMLAIGCAMMASPKVLLLDEPSLGLAPLVAREIFALIHRLNDEAGMTVFLVEQNAKMALDLASYGYIMENGKIVLDGPTAKLREDADVEEFYLGIRGAERRRFTDVKSYKRRKRWLA